MKKKNKELKTKLYKKKETIQNDEYDKAVTRSSIASKAVKKRLKKKKKYQKNRKTAKKKKVANKKYKKYDSSHQYKILINI